MAGPAVITPAGDALKIQQLAEAVRDVERDRSDLGVLAGPRRRDEPGYRWLPYKEAFSPGLVRAVLDHWSGVGGVLLDPFAGSATSLLVAAERGLASVGVELLPYAQWGADTIVRAHAADSACFRRMVGEAAEAARVVLRAGHLGSLCLRRHGLCLVRSVVRFSRCVRRCLRVVAVSRRTLRVWRSFRSSKA